MDAYKRFRRSDYILLFAALVLSAILFFVIASGKRIQFCDEMFSYTITNSDSPLYQLQENTWYSSQELMDKLTHDQSDSLRQTLTMVKQDFVHPPLYYIMFYTASAVTGNHFSKWTGLAVNFVFFMGTVAFIWLIVRDIFKSPIAALAAVMIYDAN